MVYRTSLAIAAVLLASIQTVAQTPDLIWGRNFGGINVSGLARVNRSCIATDGGVVSAGWFINEVDLDNDPTVVQLVDVGANDEGIVMKLDAAGLTEWVVRFSGSGFNRALDVATDDQGNLYALVKFDGTIDVDPGAGNVPIVALGMGNDSRDLAVVKLDAQGQYLAHQQFNDVRFFMDGANVEVNSGGDPVVASVSRFGVISSYTLAAADLSVASTYQFGFSGLDNALLGDMQLDAQDNHLYTGRFDEEFSFDPQAPLNTTPAFGTGNDIFISKVSPAGVLLWGHALGGNNGLCAGNSICASSDGGIVVTGFVGDIVDMDPGPAYVSLSSPGDPDLFLLKLSGSGSFEWVKEIGTTGEDMGWCVRADGQGVLSLTGYLGLTADVDPGPGNTTLTITDQSTIVLQFDEQGDFIWGTAPARGNFSNCPVYVDHFADASLHVHGSFIGTAIDRDPTAAVDSLYAVDGGGAFNFKWGSCTPVVPAITITADTDPVCPGLPVVFTAATSNGGAAPQYQWTVNAAPVGGNSATYSAGALLLGDEVTCMLTSDADCAQPNEALSNTVTVDCGQPLGVLIFSEYVEGSANNKALEIYNPTLADVDLADYAVALYANGSSTATQTLQLSGILPAGGVYVIANSSASPLVLAAADITSAVCTFNGDDAIALLYQGFASDVVGVIGVDPGAQWAIPTGGATADHTLRRITNVVAPESDWGIAQFQWTDHVLDDFTDLGNGFPTGFIDQGSVRPLLIPNPTREGFRLNLPGPMPARMMSGTGALVADLGNVEPGAFIRTSDMPPGLYVVEIVHAGAVEHLRLIIE